MMEWRVEVLKVAVPELQALPADMRARFKRIADLMERHGPHTIGMPLVRHLEAKLWDMRLSGRDGIARAVYVAASGRRLIVLHVFIKKTEPTPRRALETASRRGREYGLL
jgi:phage-related protein